MMGIRATGKQLMENSLEGYRFDGSAQEDTSSKKGKQVERTQQVLDEWKGVSRPLLDGGQGKQDGKKRLLQNNNVVFGDRSEGRRRRPRSLASKVKRAKSVVMASGAISIASKVGV